MAKDCAVCGSIDEAKLIVVNSTSGYTVCDECYDIEYTD